MVKEPLIHLIPKSVFHGKKYPVKQFAEHDYSLPPFLPGKNATREQVRTMHPVQNIKECEPEVHLSGRIPAEDHKGRSPEKSRKEYENSR